MQKLNSIPSHNVIPPKSIKTLFSFFSSLSKSRIKNPPFLSYLIETLNFPKERAVAISNRCSPIKFKSPDKPNSVIYFLKQVGFSESHIKSSVNLNPQILLLDIDKNLKPKIELFQHLGLEGSDLGEFISKSSVLLTVNLEKKLIPCIDILKQVLGNDRNNEDLILVLRKCCWLLCKDPNLVLLSNIAFLKSCGIVGTQLSMMLKEEPRLFITGKSKLRELISRAFDMGFTIESRMLVRGLYTISCVSEETFERKLNLFRSFGFSKDEFMEMFRKVPGWVRMSEENLKLGIEFFLNEIQFEKAVLVHAPWLLMYSIEDRLIPRYRVLQLLKSKRLLEEEHCHVTFFSMSEKEFLENFLARFSDNTEELLLAFRCHRIDSSAFQKEES